MTLCGGILLSAAFCGVRKSGRNNHLISMIALVCGFFQLSTLIIFGEERVWQLYPLIVHLPLGILLHVVFQARPLTALVSICAAYLCCQPSNWFGMLADTLTHDATVVWIVRILVAAFVFYEVLRHYAKHIRNIYNKDIRSLLIFGSVPVVYYVFDYIVTVYTDLWLQQTQLITEFLAFFHCVTFIIFCGIYYNEYELKVQSQQKNKIVEAVSQQQAKEIETIRQTSWETSILRHDMRLLLNNVAMSIEQNDKQTALELISGYVARVETAQLRRYCKNDTLNYIITSFESRCQREHVQCVMELKLEDLTVDEVLFASIICNALDNALNAQQALPEEQRLVKLALKYSNERLLLSVKNPFSGPSPLNPATQMPMSNKEGHGYGTQSIVYLTEQLGGKCQFSVEDNLFILRVIL